ncbi:hypothetical protein [Streptomyces sp. NBC_01446]|uniref:hypothetical protein n=1 Tax=unclassified Streptomyces TaxID=2593676 RepID=UPI00225A3C91|nr:hypothetical protein [Streptomyces sp. NBC_01446]MCX4649493.1 hypothetical protein [Streptomyces sp. NBC_01446]
MTGLEMGTVPTWISAFLTGGSLLMGFYILLRDRRKEEREQAVGIVCWIEYGSDESIVHILNTTTRPISKVRVFVQIGVGHGPGDIFGMSSIVAAASGETFSYPRRSEDGQKLIPTVVLFTDSSGIEWLRHLRTDTLRRRSPRRLRLYLTRLKYRVMHLRAGRWQAALARPYSEDRELRRI